MGKIDWSRRTVAQCARLHPYIPGKPVEQLLREKGLDQAVKLASNENPYGPAPAAIKAVREAAAEVHRYPNGDCTALKRALAARHKVGSEQILPGNGSNEVLELISNSVLKVEVLLIFVFDFLLNFVRFLIKHSGRLSEWAGLIFLPFAPDQPHR